ncbi:MAG: thiopurine S-methyltransferase [Pseudomonadota bacterium]|nr:thiopurine S-methyltransferase [Pseudomonadota bacterium]
MQPDFWHARWRAGQIGFHRARADSHLTRHWPDLGLPTGSRTFVPLCGKTLDLLWLRDHGHAVAGVELSVVALEAFCLENGIPTRRRTAQGFDVYEAPRLELFCGDFFALGRAQLGDLAGVFDRAALVAWPPELRAPYVDHMAKLTRAGTEMLLVTMEYPQGQTAGPPFSIPQEEVMALYGSRYEIRELSRDDVLADEPRMRSRGVTQLHEVCYRLTRL